jgi:uncharacterized protein YkwD
MRSRSQLVGLGCLPLLALLAGGCDDFAVDERGKSRPTVNGGYDDERQITVNGGEDPTEPGPGTRQDSGSTTRHDGGVAPAPKADSKPPTPPKQDSGTTPTGVCGNDFESQVFALVNQERAKAGLAALKCDLVAGKVAHDYSQLQCDKGQMGHNVGGTDPFQRMQAGGVKFSSAGENVAAGQTTPAEVMQAWMNSSGHRANILGNYAYIGVGYVPCSTGGGGWFGGYGHYWTQDFWK